MRRAWRACVGKLIAMVGFVFCSTAWRTRATIGLAGACPNPSDSCASDPGDHDVYPTATPADKSRTRAPAASAVELAIRHPLDYLAHRLLAHLLRRHCRRHRWVKRGVQLRSSGETAETHR